MGIILLVEDDLTLNKNIKMSLEMENYDVITASCLKEAGELYEKASLILLDVMLPDGRGTDFCLKVREKSNVPIIFLTSCSEEEEIVKGLDCGGDDYITKPFRLKELFSRIKANLRRVSAENEALNLTAAEQQLYEYLRINKGIVLSRSRLLEHLWDSKGTFVDDNTLSVHISRLREKLKNSGCGNIVTVRGLGYKWTE